MTLSHEALELIADPEANLLVVGPHPDPAQDRFVFHWYEMCDAVQSESYFIDSIEVSNFVLPLYFTGTRDTDEIGARNDFLGRPNNGLSLSSFGVKPGGYVGFFDPETGRMETFAADLEARKRLAIKQEITALKGIEVTRTKRHLGSGSNKRLPILTTRPAADTTSAPTPAMIPVKESPGQQPKA